MPPQQPTSAFAGPPVLWRISRRCFALTVLCVALAIGTAIARGTLPPSSQTATRYAVMAFGFAPVLIIYPLGYLTQRRITRQWRRTNGRLCTFCAYDVSTLDDPGTCPECGTPYDTERDAAMWADVGLVRADAPGPPAE